MTGLSRKPDSYSFQYARMFYKENNLPLKTDGLILIGFVFNVS